MASLSAKAQSGYNYYESGVGMDVSMIRGYTNITKQYYHPAISIYGMYNYNPFLQIGLELQSGRLSGGGPEPTGDQWGRAYTNNYLGLLVHGDVQIGSMIDYQDKDFLNAIKSFYMGAGMGVIRNNNTVQRYRPSVPSYQFPGKDNQFDLTIALRIGYEIKIYDDYNQPGWAVNIGYVHNVSFGEGLDGYNDDPKTFKNNAPDQYSQIVIGFRYFFGNTVSYNKLVRVFN